MASDRVEGTERAVAPRICGVIVSYRPDEMVFGTVVRSALGQLDGLVVVDNSPDADSQQRVARVIEAAPVSAGGPRPVLLAVGQNIGLSRGINRGVRKAQEEGYSAFLLLDQDSVLAPGSVASLRDEATRMAAGGRLAILAAENEIPNPSALHRLLDSVYYRYRDRDRGSHRSPMAITSGMLVDVRIFRTVGMFDESMFLDSADHEFCLRARAAGVEVRTVPQARVHHFLGDPTGQRSALLGAELRYQNEDQLYYGTRDTLRTVRRYWVRHPVLGTTLFGFTVARTEAYRWAGPGYRPQYRAARRGWADFLALPDRPAIPSLEA